MSQVSVHVTPPAGAEGGELLVLGHSLGTSAALWNHALPLLREHFRVALWELPGHGEAPAVSGDFLIEDLTDGLVAQFDAWQQPRFFYAGLSIGGCVGLDLGLRYPDRVAGAAIVSTGARVDSPEFWVQRAQTVREQGTQALVEPSRGRWFAAPTVARYPERVEEVLGMLRATDDESYAVASSALAAFDVSAHLSEITVPILAVAGAEDQAVPEGRSQDIADGVVQGEFVRIADAAHTSPVEQPDAVADTLRRFLR